jgi:cobalt-zinc-cadmium efflux system membrane fusion protein
MKPRALPPVCVAVALALAAAAACHQKPPSGQPSQAGHQHAAPEHDHDEHDEHDDHAHAEHTDEVRLSPEAIQRYGIRVEPAATHTLTPTLLAPARVVYNPEHMAHVGAPLTGRVAEFRARPGDPVQKGDPLLVIESAELGEAQSDFLQKRAAARAAAPAVALARNAHERAAALYDKSQGIALTEVQKREAESRAAEAALLTAQAAATAAENRLRLYGMNDHEIAAVLARDGIDPRLTITAPIAGQVLERAVTLGQRVGPDREALLVLANLETLWVLADVPEMRLAEVSTGAPALVTVGPAGSAPLEGEVAAIAPALDPATRTAQVRVVVRPGPGTLRPGMFARVEIRTQPRGHAARVLAVPDQAVQTVEGGPAVFVPVEGEPGAFARRAITAGRAVGGMVPVLSGLAEGEPYVAAGSFLLKAELGKGSASHEH